MISKSTIDKVYETARLEEVIGEFVTLKKAGSNYKGLSPFSEERTPSFMVSPVKQIWKDFSSGKGGNVVAFLMEHEHFSYPEAIKWLAKKYNIEIEETEQTNEEKAKATERESLYAVSDYAQKFFHDTLFETPEGKSIGLSYFKERGYTEETIKQFKLGYSPDRWTAFTDTALREQYKLDYLAKTGLTIVKEDKKFDRFKGRVMFPIHSMSGRVLGFGGRILKNDKKAAKYLNSPESDIYHKSKVLYGIYYAKQRIAKEDNCLLVEGYTDVISMHQAGIKNVVSSSGTALTPDQIRLIKRLTNTITVLFDGDAAGLRASIRGIDLILEQGMNVRVLTFPDGDDPDSFAQKHSTEDILHYITTNAQDFIAFKANLLMEDATNDPIKKGALVRDMINSISKIPNAIQQEIYLKECSKIMDVSEAVLFNELAQILTKNKKDKHKTAQREQQQPLEVVKREIVLEKVDRQKVLEYQIIALLLLYGNDEFEFEDAIIDDDGELRTFMIKQAVAKQIFLHLQADEIEFSNELFKEVYEEVQAMISQNEDLDINHFVNHTNTKVTALVTHILMDEERYLLHDWERKQIYVKEKKEMIAQLTTETILNLRRLLIDKLINEIKNEFKDKEVTDDDRDLIMDYAGLKKEVSVKLNRVV
jgi:DNA primase